MPEWSAYSFEVFRDDGRRFFNATPVQTLFHIVHVPDAQEVLRRDRISSRPVYDDSKLNATRLHVVWLSPNHWSTGSFYGNVRFSFPWGGLISDCKLYWVESITSYSPHAPRFLVSRKSVEELGGYGMVVPYDPTKDDGPIVKNEAGWFWNGAVTLEVMVDRDIAVHECTLLEIVEHHPTICRGRHPRCLYKGVRVSQPGAEFLAYVIGSGIHSIDEAWTPDIGLPGGCRYHSDLVYAFMGLQGRLTKGRSAWDGPVSSKVEARHIVRAACLQIAHGNGSEARELVGLIATEQLFTSALTETLRRHFGLQEITLIG